MAGDGWLKAALRVRAEQIDAVRALHQPHLCTGFPNCTYVFGGQCAYEGDCDQCRTPYPCATIRALDGGGQ